MRRVPRGFVKGPVGTLEAMRQAGSRAVAVISVHASPLSDLGSGENGGMNLAIRRLCEGLSLRGVPTDVFVRRDGPGPDEELIAPLSRLVRLPVGPPAPLRKEDVRGAARRFHRCHDPPRASPSDVRIAPSTATTGTAAWSGRQLREAWDVAWVQSFHTLALTKARAGLPLDALRAQAEGELAAQADRLVAASAAEAKDLIRLYRASRDRICVAQPGVDPRLFAEHDGSGLRRSLGLADARVALFAGRLEPLKGAQILLDAAALLRARRGVRGPRRGHRRRRQRRRRAAMTVAASAAASSATRPESASAITSASSAPCPTSSSPTTTRWRTSASSPR